VTTAIIQALSFTHHVVVAVDLAQSLAYHDLCGWHEFVLRWGERNKSSKSPNCISV